MNKKTFRQYESFYIDHICNGKHDMPVQHYHDSYEIYLQMAGERYVFLDNICHILKQGDIAVFKPFDLHYAKSFDVEHYERYVINCRPEELSVLLPENEIKSISEMDSCILHPSDEEYDLLLNCFRTADAFYKMHTPMRAKLVQASVFQILSVVSRLVNDANKVNAEGMPPVIASILEYINANYNEHITLDMLSKRVYMSKQHICRLFHASTGATFLEYLQNVRLTKVHRMLYETDMPLHEIAERTGFSSTAAMTRTFKSIYNISPRDFRKNKKESKTWLN